LYKPLVQAVPRTEKRVISAIFKKYLQCVLAARIFTVDFVVCTLAVKKKIRAGFDMSDRTIPLLVAAGSSETFLSAGIHCLTCKKKSNFV
jgi:hypothetical protein